MNIFIIDADSRRVRQLRTVIAGTSISKKSVDSCSTTRQAMELLRKKRFDCTFLGISKEPEGLEILSSIRGSISSRKLPVILYASNVTKDYIVRAMAAGATTFLAYPFSVEDVESILGQFLSSRADV